MAYVTNINIEDRLSTATYIQLTDDDGDNVADVTVVDEARLGAEGEVNSYLARRFEVPIDLTLHTELADILKSITLDLVEYRLRSRRPPVPKDALQRRADAVNWLARVADGSVDLPSTTNVAASTTKGSIAESVGEDRLLTRDELSDF